MKTLTELYTEVNSVDEKQTPSTSNANSQEDGKKNETSCKTHFHKNEKETHENS